MGTAPRIGTRQHQTTPVAVVTRRLPQRGSAHPASTCPATTPTGAPSNASPSCPSVDCSRALISGIRTNQLAKSSPCSAKHAPTAHRARRSPAAPAVSGIAIMPLLPRPRAACGPAHPHRPRQQSSTPAGPRQGAAPRPGGPGRRPRHPRSRDPARQVRPTRLRPPSRRHHSLLGAAHVAALGRRVPGPGHAFQRPPCNDGPSTRLLPPPTTSQANLKSNV